MNERDGTLSSISPQAAQMAHASMVRTLAAQAEAMWPQEGALLERYALAGPVTILDVGCGTGEITARLAARYPEASILGIDLDAAHLARAAARCAAFGARVRFAPGNAMALESENDTFDLAVCRHMLQVVPDVGQVLDEMIRVVRPGGWLHLLAEDYAMIQAHPTRLDPDRFWHAGAIAFGTAVGTDLRVGRRVFTLLAERGLAELSVDYIVADSLRVPPETLVVMLEAWREGFADVIARTTTLSLDEVHAHFDDFVACLRHPHGYFVWNVPVISGRVPG